MVTGTGVGVEADTEGAEPIVKKAITHSAIAAEIVLLCRIINILFLNDEFPFVVLAFFDIPLWEVISGRSPCTAGNPAKGYAERLRIVKSLHR